MPSYLDTPYRKSYGEGGYNLVFFAPNAPVGTPNSIEEEPEEVVLYRVKIMNTGATLPDPVKLSAPIFKLQASPGEKQFPIEGTYNDVVEHLLEPRISGRIMPGEILEIQYNFEKEEKTVRFVFVDMSTSTPVSLDQVLPSVIFADGTRQPISSETFTFRGSEIYADKRLIAENPSLSISSRSERLDLSRLSNGQEHKIYVQQGFSLPVDPSLMGLTISFVNKSTGQTLSFSNQNAIHLSGRASDWNVFVDTDYYFAPIQALLVQANGQWGINGLQRKNRNETKRPEFPIKPSKTTVAVQTKTPTLPYSSSQEGDSLANKRRNNKTKWHKYIVFISLLLLLLVGGWMILEESNDTPTSQNQRTKETIGEDINSKSCSLIYFDNTEDERNRDYIEVCRDVPSNKHYSHYVFTLLNEDKRELKINDDYLLVQEDSFNNNKQYLLHRLTIKDNCDSKSFYIRVSYLCGDNALQIIDKEIPDDILKSNSLLSVNLGIRLSQLNWYKELEDKKEFNSKDDKDKWIEKIRTDLIESEFKNKLLELANNKGYKTSNSSSEKNPTTENDKTNGIPDLLNSNSWQTAAQLRDDYQKEKVSKNIYDRAQAMIKALEKVSLLQKAPTQGLSSTQKKTIDNYNKGLEDETYSKILSKANERGELTSFSQLWRVVQDFVFRVVNENNKQ